MPIATSLRSTSDGTYRIQRRVYASPLLSAAYKARVLGKPTVIQMLSPRAITNRELSGFGEEAPAPNAWDNTNKALSALSTTVGAGTKFYLEQQQMKQAQAAANAAQNNAEAARRAADLSLQADAEARRAALLAAASTPQGGMPSWVLPVAIGGVALLAIGGFFLFKKKAASP
jgi:hypothetical protein